MADQSLPQPMQILMNQAMSLHQNGQLDQAIVAYQRILSASPQNAHLLYLLGTAYCASGRFDDGLGCLDKAIVFAAGQPGIHFNRGNALINLRRFDDAISSFDKVLKLNPNAAEAWSGRGRAQMELNRLEDALSSYTKALALMPNNPEAHLDRGVVLMSLKRFGEALAAFEKALSLHRGYFEAWSNRGLALSQLGRYAEAGTSLETALQLQPGNASLKAALLVARTYVCDWRERDLLLNDTAKSLQSGTVMDAFESLALYDEPMVHRRCAEIRTAGESAGVTRLSPKPPTTDKIRIGYLSSDFHNHPTAYLMAEVFEHHDRNRFEIIAFSTGPLTEDAMQARLRKAFDAFHEVSSLSDDDLAKLITAQNIEILVDLKGYTAMGRTAALARRPAPVQVSFLGFPGTLGADYVDYIIGDPVVTPPGCEPFYAEKIVRLPRTYQPNSLRPASLPATRETYGLPSDAIVFCSFNNSYKITPCVFSSWMNILQAVPGSVLWLLAINGAESNLRKEALARGVQPERLVFAPGVEWADHMARLALADIALDTAPYGSHTTASDVLWAGVPLITCAGPSFASRVAASLVTAAGAPELVRPSLQDCEAYAISLARDPSALAACKSKLLGLRETSALFDSADFTHDLEAAFCEMSARSRQGLPPSSFDVPRLSS